SSRASYHRVSLFLLLTRPPPRPTLFPYTTLFRSRRERRHRRARQDAGEDHHRGRRRQRRRLAGRARRRPVPDRPADRPLGAGPGDRKSTRLNSSHRTISYAVFCLKKKNTKETIYH